MRPGSARDSLYLFLPGGIHGDTVAQGPMANAVLAAPNGACGTGVPLLTDAEILARAGLAPNPSWDGTSFDVSPQCPARGAGARERAPVRRRRAGGPTRAPAAPAVA